MSKLKIKKDEYREMGRAEMIAASAYSPWRVFIYHIDPTV